MITKEILDLYDTLDKACTKEVLIVVALTINSMMLADKEFEYRFNLEKDKIAINYRTARENDNE